MKNIFKDIEILLLENEVPSNSENILRTKYERSLEKEKEIKSDIRELKNDDTNVKLNQKKIEDNKVKLDKVDGDRSKSLNDLRQYKRLNESNTKALNMLYNGTSGNILNFFMNDKISNISPSEYEVLRKIKDDYLSRTIVSKIKKELKKKNPDMRVIRDLKLDFRKVYTRIKNSLK